MKRYFTIALCLVLVLLIWGCDSTKQNDDAPTQGLHFYDDFYYNDETIYLIRDGKPAGHSTSLFSCKVSLDDQAYPVSFLWAIIGEELCILPPEDNSLIVEPIGKNTDVVHVSIYVESQEKTYHFLGNLFSETLTPIGPETDLNIKELSVSPDLSYAVATLGKNEAIAYYDREKWTNLDLSGENLSGKFLENGTCLISSVEAISEASYLPPKHYITLYNLHCDLGILDRTIYEKVLLSEKAGLTLYGSRYATDTSGYYLSIVDLVLDTTRELPIATEDIKSISASRDLFIVYLKSGELYAVKKSIGQIVAIGNAPDRSAAGYNHVLSNDGHIYLNYLDSTGNYPLYRFTPDIPGEPLSEEDLRWFNEEFFSPSTLDAQGERDFNIRNMFLRCEFNSPESIDLGLLFRHGLGEYDAVSQEEMELYNKITGNDWALDYSKITLEDMTAIFQENTGLHLSQTLKVGLDKLVYLEEYKAFYHRHGDTAYLLPEILSGERFADGTVKLYYKDKLSRPSPIWRVTLKPAEGTYHFVSNLPTESIF